MKKFERLLKGHKSLVFLDFEGTQFSHEMIAIGAVHAVIDRHGYIKKSKKPFRIYVKAHNRVGKIVTDLTGITEDMLKQKGVTFFTAMSELRKYVGLSGLDFYDQFENLINIPRMKKEFLKIYLMDIIIVI